MPSNFTVQYHRATAEDFLEIAALDRVSWRTNKDPEFIPDGEHAWRMWVEHALTFTARRGPELAGAVLAFPCQDLRWCLHKVMVHESMRGQGIGGGLFEVLLKELDSLGADVFLTVDPANTAALTLYESWGFDEKEFKAGFYRPEEDRLVLTRRAQ